MSPCSSTRIRAGDSSALEAIAQLERDCFGDHSWSRSQISSELLRPHGLHRVLSESSLAPLLAMTLGWVLDDEAELLRIAVQPSARRQGLGSRMLVDFIEAARQRGGVSSPTALPPPIAVYASYSFPWSVSARNIS